MIRFLKQIEKYPDWQYLINTPNDKHMNVGMMKLLIQHPAQKNLYEIIFVLLMVYKKEIT